MTSQHKLPLTTGFQIFAVVLVYLVCVTGGYKVFNLWGQLRQLIGENPLTVLDHLHGLRYLVTWPSIALADLLGADRNLVFGFFVFTNIALTTFFLARMQVLLTSNMQHDWTKWFCLYFPILALLSFSMNGRLSYMLLGSVIMPLTYIFWIKAILQEKSALYALRYSLFNVVALALLYVSSGCFMVGMLTVLSHTLLLGMMARRERLAHMLLNLLSLAPFITLQLAFVEKNLAFYDGSVFSMLMHGAGRMVTRLDLSKPALSTILATLAFLAILLAGYLRHFARRNPLLIPPLVLILNALLVGLLGLSALLTGLMAAMALGLHMWCSAFTARRPIGELVRHSIQLNWRHYGMSARLQLLSMTTAAVIFTLSMILLPDDWSKFIVHIKEADLDADVLADFRNPAAIAVDSQNNMYIAYGGHRIMRIDATGKMELYAGGREAGDVYGDRLQARFSNIGSLAANRGNLYVADTGNNKVKLIEWNGAVRNVAGTGEAAPPQLGMAANETTLDHPRSIFVLPNDELLVIDSQRNMIVKIDGKRRIQPFLGTPRGNDEE
jgi:hypothetical protein